MENRHIFLPALSGALLVFSFPPFDFSSLAWIAFIPLLFSIKPQTSFLRVMGFSGITALLFYSITLFWLNHVALIGWVFVTFLETFFFLIFGATLYFGVKIKNLFLKVLFIGCGFVMMEWVRAELPVWGFGWNLLGHTQTNHLHLLQFSNLFGVYGLGFSIIVFNVLGFEFIQCFFQRKQVRFRVIYIFFLMISFFLAVYFYGVYSVKELKEKPEDFVRISVIQPNISQKIKWDSRAKDKIIEINNNLTKLSAMREPELIIWPEASFPGYLNFDYRSMEVLELSQALDIPLLVGAPFRVDKNKIHNSAFLIDKGFIYQQYEKMRLVPFGEYVPWKWLFGFLEPLAYSMGVSDFSEGAEQDVFSWRNEKWPFSVLICFEDIFPSIARKAVGKGARFLTVMTNDAWFGETAAPFQHLQGSILRAVENGVAVIRSANTGVSAFISNSGEVLNIFQGRDEKILFTQGELTFEMPMQNHQTFYSRGGYLFPWFAVLLWILIFFVSRKQREEVK